MSAASVANFICTRHCNPLCVSSLRGRRVLGILPRFRVYSMVLAILVTRLDEKEIARQGSDRSSNITILKSLLTGEELLPRVEPRRLLGKCGVDWIENRV